MKKKLVFNSLLFKTIALVSCFLLVMLHNKSKATDAPTIVHAHSRVDVNFKHDVEKNELTISIKSSREAAMQFFIFSPDGILIKEVSVSARKNTTIYGLKKGFYLYECFDNDERMKSGSLLIK